MEALSYESPEFPSDAKFVIFKYHGTQSTLQIPVIKDETKNWEYIKAQAPYSYGFVFHDANHKELPCLYLMDVDGRKVRDIVDLTEHDIYFTLEETAAFDATGKAGVQTYVVDRIQQVLAFDPKTMKII